MMEILLWILAAPTIIWLLTYLPNILVAYLPVQNLKKKYKAQWALVTGGGSGIGKALVESLALQGFNVVIVSLDDAFLRGTFDSVKAAFPRQEFRKVAVTFAPGVDYMTPIKEATKDINVQCLFNNAGYLVTGFYDSTSAAKQQGNMECNATAAAQITHHFLGLMLKEGLTGCVVFTSSVVAFMPSPFSVMYGATKGFLSNFAASLAVEVRAKGVDVLAIHPSPVASNFYANLDHKIEMVDQAQKSAVAPSALPDEIFRSVGRVVWRDIGAMAICVRVFTQPLAYNFLTTVFAIAAPFLPDYRNNDSKRGG